jgi:molecular chaperone GrpE
MKSNTNEHFNSENQDIENSEGAAFDPNDTATCDASCDNMTDGDDTVAEDGANGMQPLTPEEEAAIWKDKFVRLSAEYDNYRKRTLKEKMDIIAAGGEDVVRSMLEVLDDMDRALEAIAKTDDIDAVRQGIMLIDTKLRGALKGRGLEEIEAVGSELDTDLHEAIARIETQDAALKGKIIDVVQKGYKLKDKIIRYAKVVVGQ